MGCFWAVPGLILLSIPALIESQGENLALGLGGLALLPVGLLVGGVAGWHPDPRGRRGALVGGGWGALFGLLLLLLSLFLPSPGFVGLAALVVSTVTGLVIGRRRSPSPPKESST